MNMSVAAWRKHAISEHDLQVAVLENLKARAKPGYFCFAIPNGGERPKRTGARLKQQGVHAGVADLCIMLPDSRVAWLELKAVNGQLTPQQVTFREICLALRHWYAVARTLDEAMTTLLDWGILRK